MEGLVPIAVTLAELVAHLDGRNWHLSQTDYRLLRSEVHAGRVWGVRNGGGAQPSATLPNGTMTNGGAPPALFGVRPLGGSFDGLGYTWFSVIPNGLSRTIVPFTRIARRIIFHEAGSFAAVVCTVDDGNRNGQRLALACGFQPTPMVRSGWFGAMREWRLVGHERDLGQHHRQDGEAPGEARHRRAAPAGADDRG